MLCILHTVYNIIHCVVLHTLCDIVITQRVSNYYSVKYQFLRLFWNKITPGKFFYTGTACGACDKYQAQIKYNILGLKMAFYYKFMYIRCILYEIIQNMKPKGTKS